MHTHGMTTAAYKQLMSQWSELEHLMFFQRLAGWDRECIMPSAASAQRTEHLVFLNQRIHALETSTAYADALSAAEASADDLSELERMNLSLMRRSFDKSNAIDSAWVTRWSEQRGKNGQSWKTARSNSDFSIFQKDLEKTVGLLREKAEMLGYEDEAYDALHDAFEIGSSTADVRRLFASLAPACSDLIKEIQESDHVAPAIPTGPFSEARQDAITAPILASMGFDQERGVVAHTVHPFCSRMDADDVRLAVRYEPNNIFQYIGALMHEAGHGLYGQGLPAKYAGTKVGDAVSLGIHESQSRLWENYIGRSEAYSAWLLQCLQSQVPAFQGLELPTFYRMRNQITESRIRIEADEISYNLHIILRFEMELALLSGELSVQDLPDAWNKRFEALLGYRVRNDAEGCLQDVHWSMGAFGYFPTYSMGNCYAAQFFHYAKRALPDLENDAARGNTDKLGKWLQKNIYQHGSRYMPSDLCIQVTGEHLNPVYLLNSLRERYLVS